MTMVTIIGRGHSGTRAISQALYASGVYMGRLLNPSADLVPPEKMYEACRVMAKYVQWQGDLTWRFDDLHTIEIEPAFIEPLEEYLDSVLNSQAEHRGWKIPETTLVFPWIVRRFPEIKYIFWIRDPRDCILNRHKTDDLRDFGIEYPATEDLRLRRAISWIYQYKLVKVTPKPQYWLEVRFEDFVLRHEETITRLEEFLGFELARIPVRPEAVERWKQDDGVHFFDFFTPAMLEYGYEM